MFILFYIIGLMLLIFPLVGIKKFKQESTGKKVTRLVFLALGLFLIGVGVMDMYELISNPTNYMDTRL